MTAEVVRGGDVAGGMGVNLPDVETSLPSLTPHDHGCLEAALNAGVDAFSLSFVRRAQDVVGLRQRMAKLGRVVPIIAKLEKAQAVVPEMLCAILEVADAVMIARGDLGAETAPEKVPVLQKEILRAARGAGVPAITATEMLESMIHEPRPTRAEAADVANAVYDGSDAVMLSAETAVGDHPALAVAACSRIIDEAERHGDFRAAWATAPCQPKTRDPVADAVAEAAAAAGEHLRAAAIVCFTQTGRTARLVARHRPATPILALTPRLGGGAGALPRVGRRSARRPGAAGRSRGGGAPRRAVGAASRAGEGGRSHRCHSRRAGGRATAHQPDARPPRGKLRADGAASSAGGRELEPELQVQAEIGDLRIAPVVLPEVEAHPGTSGNRGEHPDGPVERSRADVRVGEARERRAVEPGGPAQGEPPSERRAAFDKHTPGVVTPDTEPTPGGVEPAVANADPQLGSALPPGSEPAHAGVPPAAAAQGALLSGGRLQRDRPSVLGPQPPPKRPRHGQAHVPEP